MQRFGCQKKVLYLKITFDIIPIAFECIRSSANDMKGAEPAHSQTNIFSQSEVEWGRSWESMLQPSPMFSLSFTEIALRWIPE